MQRFYRIEDTRTDKIILEEGTAKEVEQLIGLESIRVCTYASQNRRYKRRYLITMVDELDSWEQDFKRKWDYLHRRYGNVRKAD